jgi:hypothetical protein
MLGIYTETVHPRTGRIALAKRLIITPSARVGLNKVATKKQATPPIKDELQPYLKAAIIGGGFGMLAYFANMSQFSFIVSVSTGAIYGGFVPLGGEGAKWLLRESFSLVAFYYQVKSRQNQGGIVFTPAAVESPKKAQNEDNANTKIVRIDGKEQKWSFPFALGFPSLKPTSHSITKKKTRVRITDDLFTRVYILSNGTRVTAQITGRFLRKILDDAALYPASVDRGKSLSERTLKGKIGGADNYRLFMELVRDAEAVTGLVLIRVTGQRWKILNYRAGYCYIVIQATAVRGESLLLGSLPPTPPPRVA